MEKILSYLQESIADEMFSKNEKRSLRALVEELAPNEDQLNFLRSQLFSLANEKISTTNQAFILEWLKAGVSVLTIPTSTHTEVYFSPGETCADAIIRNIDRATANLRVCVFTISDDRITKSLLTAHQRGVKIQMITDNDKSLDLGSDIQQLKRAGIPTRMDATPNHMHHKFMIVDGRVVITGSYNWTRSAARFNQENIVVTRETGVIQLFQEEFDKLWQQMKLMD
ncbi:MAG: phospholipase D-like domain-containing protein [Cyclobacteriaceae bacterium]|jgi:cardiolipin hydrolase